MVLKIVSKHQKSKEMENFIFNYFKVRTDYELSKNAKFKAILKRIAKENECNLIGFTVNSNVVTIILDKLVYTIEFTETTWKPLKSQLLFTI